MAAVNPNGTKTLLGNGETVFFIKGKLNFINGPRSLPRNPSNCTILDSQVFKNLILTDEPFAKALQSLKTCVSINKN